MQLLQVYEVFVAKERKKKKMMMMKSDGCIILKPVFASLQVSVSVCELPELVQHS